MFVLINKEATNEIQNHRLNHKNQEAWLFTAWHEQNWILIIVAFWLDVEEATPLIRNKPEETTLPLDVFSHLWKLI